MIEQLELRITFVLSKLRNICYYWSIDDREYKVYIHVIRTSRNQLKELLNLMSTKDIRRPLFIKLIKTIPKKIKNSECEIVINNLKNILSNVK